MTSADHAYSLLPMLACLARDLDEANILTETSRKIIWNWLAEHGQPSLEASPTNAAQTQASLDVLRAIAPAGDG